MFTGIISHIGYVDEMLTNGTGICIYSGFRYGDIAIGDSIACDGICLTVIKKGSTGLPRKKWLQSRAPNKEFCWFHVEISPETLAKTTAKKWFSGEHNIPINLERALKLGDTLDGHLVSGHVDGLASILSITPDKDSHRIECEAPAELSRFIAAKGSVTLDGVSLTVNEVNDNRFMVNIIPHTWQVTTFSKRKVGDKVNLEIDLIARYVARLLGK